MTTNDAFRVLIATDGSPAARAAVATALAFPWPAAARAHAVIARRTWETAGRAAYAVGALTHVLHRVASETATRLRRRWPDVAVRLVDGTAVDVIVREAARLRADVVVVGWRGHGTFRRLLLGSVSRGVVERVRGAVLVVRSRRAPIESVVIGFDGSRNARRAVAFLARLRRPRAGRVTLVRVVDPAMEAAIAFTPPAARQRLNREFAALHRQDVAAAQRSLEAAARPLRRAGWSVRTVVASGEPLHELLAVADTADADLVVVGARGVGRVARFVIGSVAEGVMNRSRAAVLVVR
jgi:nucleotide-binding universal stress UspA family protein